ncbi:MAG: biotin--[acetyl-CoA-carboxylase] ligase [Lachnospiraceae bacterium]|jgi:BirA family biotin operon repressor/biotin-[acetyl-CoA-carboxylase] ligase|nr:biotin--[acetyl-CoA-carboxylase] ligase [Lachnospiraceae bacterium]
MKEKVLYILKEAGDYVSGQELCERLGVSRTAIWKIVGQLKEEGYQIEAVKNRGYHMLFIPDVITEAEIGSRLNTKVMGRSCVCYEETDSTNIRAKKLAEEDKPHGTLVCAEKQTGGKGRRGRAWSSPSGEAIYMSLLLRPQIQPVHASMLTLVMGLAAAEACNEVLGEAMGEKSLKVQIKWPNDLVLDGKKIAGILTEMSVEMEYIHYVVIGIGINVNTKSFPGELEKTAGSLYQTAGRSFARADLIARCMKCFEKYYEIFCRTENFSVLKKSYGDFLVNTGKMVRVLEPGNEYTGTALGINDSGELLVEREEGQVVAVYAGEVSVRGVYGYV